MMMFCAPVLTCMLAMHRARRVWARSGRAVVLLSVLVACSPSWALTGKVVRVIDGDTIEVLVDSKPVRVRLAQIDAPESKQAFGTRSRQALVAMVAGIRVDVEERGSDRYGRVIGQVRVGDLDVNAAMVRQGMAWVYDRYSVDFRLKVLQVQARNERLGLWSDPDPTPPWDFRRSQDHR